MDTRRDTYGRKRHDSSADDRYTRLRESRHGDDVRIRTERAAGDGSRPGEGRRHEASYDEASRRRFGSGGGVFGFGPGGGGLPWVFGFLVLGMVLVAGRLFYLQVLEGPSLAKAAEDRRTNVMVLQARRGTIYDRNGNVLAKSEECYDVYCNPREVADVHEMADLVATYLGGSAEAYRPVLEQDTTFAYLARLADKDACEELRAELIARSLAGVYLIGQMRRVYPYGGVAGQVLGFVDVDGNGVTGLELAYDTQLKGTDGEMIMETGLNGIPIAGAASQVTSPQDGQDLILALDVDIQRSVEENVLVGVEESKATSGFAMVMDPRTGEVIAACSTPYADLTREETRTDESLRLKLVSDSYEPGSIAKVLTAAIGLESGTVDTNTYFTVPVSIMVGEGIVFDVDERNTVAEMNLREMLRRSSNVGAALIAQEAIGARAFSEGMEAFGIGTPTGIDYPGEAAGIIKPLELYDASSVGSMSFGQGFSVPMVQMVRAVGAIADKGVMRTPHFAVSVGGRELDWSATQQAVSEMTAEKVADMMRTVVEDGTATSAAVEGYDVAAKTGTGEIAENGKYVADKYLASLIGFAPVQDPQVLVYVGLNETPYLSYSSAGPVFSAIMGDALFDLGVLSTLQIVVGP